MDNKNRLPFTRTNYIIMLAGIFLLFLGFTIMTFDKEPYGLGFLGLTLGPVIVMAGFITEFFAIMYKAKKQ